MPLRHLRRRPLVVSTMLLVFVLSLTAAGWAQRRYQERWGGGNVVYDGRFTFVRARYQLYFRQGGWEFDYPDMEQHLMTMLRETTRLRARIDGSNILTFDDPELFKYPVAYLSEPGYWHMDQAEAAGLRTYLLKGGFLIVDDFMQNEWVQFNRTIHLALPEARIMPLTIADPVFDWFFRIRSLDMNYPTRFYSALKAEFYGIYEDNDPAKRLMVVINYNNDLGDYMEHSEQGIWPVNISNDAYKFMINYLMYGLTR